MRRSALGLAPLCLVFLSHSAQAQPDTKQSGTKQPDTKRMAQIVQDSITSQHFMGTVLVERDGKAILDEGYGSADLEWNVPNVPETRFRLGSITKQFTAASILLLEERGKLKVEDPISKYMPDEPAAWKNITFFHLLTHTSGIPSFTSFPDYNELQSRPVTPEQLVARFRDKPLDFQPGEKWNYSNSGYALLGYLLEKISGENYCDFLQQNIFTPLVMHDSGCDRNSMILPRRASGYTPGPHGLENSGYIDMTVPFSAGELYSTTGDLLRWQQALFGGKLLNPASFKKMTTPFKENYGFGLEIQTIKGRERISHGGGINGFNTFEAWYPPEKLSIIVLSNVNGNSPEEISDRLASVMHNEPVVLPSERKRGRSVHRHTLALCRGLPDSAQIRAHHRAPGRSPDRAGYQSAFRAHLRLQPHTLLLPRGRCGDRVLHGCDRQSRSPRPLPGRPRGQGHQAVAIEISVGCRVSRYSRH
jgi:CubicO group peptidase (beta-lactamase class C family)